MVTNLQSDGVVSQPLMPLPLSLAAGAGFVARGFSGDAIQLSRIIKAAIKYKGFSFIDILQPCVSFNRINTYGWYKERIYTIDSATHDPENFSQAMDLAMEWEERIPLGILYQKNRIDFTSQLKPLEQGTLIDAPYLREKINDRLSGKV
jgi:2-oxoglutarate ferredoxin oxidoreductase subunit beta